jgi:hypothetical protein
MWGVLRCEQDAGDHKGPHPSTTPHPPLRMSRLRKGTDKKPSRERQASLDRVPLVGLSHDLEEIMGFKA